jgi:hypothetical protein
MLAFLIGSGTSKSGCPIDKLIGFFIVEAISSTLRIPLESKARERSDTQDLGDDALADELVMSENFIAFDRPISGGCKGDLDAVK